MTISIIPKRLGEDIRHSSSKEYREKKGGWRSRGWTPIAYPKSAVLRKERNGDAFAYFPLHPDVLRAAVRELLLLDGTLDPSTLTVCGKAGSMHEQSTENEPNDRTHIGKCCSTNPKKRKRTAHRYISKKPKFDHADCSKLDFFPDDEPVGVHIEIADQEHRPCVENLVASILALSLAFESPMSEQTGSGLILEFGPDSVRKPPRKVSEADHLEPDLLDDQELGLRTSQEISNVLDLTKRSPEGFFTERADIGNVSNLLYVSISNEAILRDAAMKMTQELIAPFEERALRLFFGYKTPAIPRDRLSQLMAGFLFDTSHAMFAWSQTEQEVLSRTPDAADLDSVIRKTLFDNRALRKIGGFDPSSIVPQAISIGRLQRRNLSWGAFAMTAQGKKTLEHHAKEKTVISVGKQRRGQRLRQRNWLTSALLWQENDYISITTTPRSRSCSISSETDDDLSHLCNNRVRKIAVDSARRVRILSDMPGSRAISLVKQSPGKSWGVGLVQEGSACVVGKAQDPSLGSDEDSFLRCGDMILHVQNEDGTEACSPLCTWSSAEHATDDWFRHMVDLFKKSKELHLVIQRL